MALKVNEFYNTDGITKVFQAAPTPEQEQWLQKYSPESAPLPETPAQKLFLALCKNGYNFKDADDSCRFTGDERREARNRLKIKINKNGFVERVHRPSFVGAKLANRDLRKADLLGADLLGADLLGADLLEADLRVADLRGADLGGARLAEARLPEANLRGADLGGADLGGAELWSSYLDGPNLSLTDLSGANFEKAKNLGGVHWDLAFYDATNPPNLRDDIKNRLLGLDEESYKQAKELQTAYRVAVRTDNNKAIQKAEKELTDYLQGKAKEAEAKAKAEAELGKAIAVVANPASLLPSGESLTVSVDGSALEGAGVSGNVSLGGDKATSPQTAIVSDDFSVSGLGDHYTRYGYGPR